MSVTRAQVEQVAALARLHLGADEADRLTVDLNRILERVAVLMEVDVAGVDGSGVVSADPAPLRDDVETATLNGDCIAAQAPDWRDGFFVVPRLPALDRDPDDEG